MIDNEIEASMEPEPGDEHYEPSRIERLKRWLTPDKGANQT